MVENKLLTVPGQPAKRHIEFELPKGMAYAAGDYLAVCVVFSVESPERLLMPMLASLTTPKPLSTVFSLTSDCPRSST